jgi:hypothetical protein
MDFSEFIRTTSEVIMALFTIVLTWVTYVLAKNTKKIDDHEMEQRRVQDLQRCIFLAESIIHPEPQEAARLTGLSLASKDVHPFNELLTLNKYVHDSDTKRQLEHVAGLLTSALEGPINPSLNNPQVRETFQRFRSRLVQEVVEWQRDLGSYIRS